MKRVILLPLVIFLTGFAMLSANAAPPSHTQTYKLDPMHCSIYFKIRHVGISYVWGRFDNVAGTFTVGNKTPTFNFTVPAASVDTNVKMRDNDLRSKHFFDVKKYPNITFKSTDVKTTKNGYEVTGKLTLHGITHTVHVVIVDNGTAQFPKGVHRRGLTTELSIRRSDYKMIYDLPLVGDQVILHMNFEGIRQ